MKYRKVRIDHNWLSWHWLLYPGQKNFLKIYFDRYFNVNFYADHEYSIEKFLSQIVSELQALKLWNFDQVYNIKREFNEKYGCHIKTNCFDVFLIINFIISNGFIKFRRTSFFNHDLCISLFLGVIYKFDI